MMLIRWQGNAPICEMIQITRLPMYVCSLKVVDDRLGIRPKARVMWSLALAEGVTHRYCILVHYLQVILDNS
jgi:hypothetical protein